MQSLAQPSRKSSKEAHCNVPFVSDNITGIEKERNARDDSQPCCVLYNEFDGETGYRAIFSAPTGVTLTINSFDMGNFGGAVIDRGDAFDPLSSIPLP